MTNLKQNRYNVWYQPNGPHTAFKPLGQGSTSATGGSHPGPGFTPVYSTDRFGQPVVEDVQVDPPSGLPTRTIGFYEVAAVHPLEKMQARGCDVYLQIRVSECGTLDNPTQWDTITHYGRARVGDMTPADGPVTPFGGAIASGSANVTARYQFKVVKVTLSALTTTEANNLLDIAWLTDAQCGDCGSGYKTDQVAYIVCSPAGGATANVLYTANGGGSWATTSADPFSADETINEVEWGWISPNQFRLIVSCGTAVAGAKPKIAYADVTLGAEATTVWTAVVSTSTSAANNETVSALAWLFHDRLYIATSAGEIYVEGSQGESWAATAVYTGSTAVNAFCKSPDGQNVWAVGASNLILRESRQSGVFATRTGPSGGGAMRAVAVAADNTLFVGNGSSIYKSSNDAENTGGWTQLKDFGSNKVVEQILFGGELVSNGGDSQVIRVVVDDTAGSTAALWETVDGGASWRQITTLSNTGYNAAKQSLIDNNKIIIVGDGGKIHLAS